MCPVSVKPIADVVKRWEDIASGRGAAYEAGVKGAGSSWEKGALDAAKNFAQAITSGNIQAMFAGGIRRAGAAKYDRKASGIGVARFSGGIHAGATDYQAGVTPFLETIASLDLGARGMRNSDTNFERVKKIGTALNKKRLALRAAGA